MRPHIVTTLSLALVLALPGFGAAEEATPPAPPPAKPPASTPAKKPAATTAKSTASPTAKKPAATPAKKPAAKPTPARKPAAPAKQAAAPERPSNPIKAQPVPKAPVPTAASPAPVPAEADLAPPPDAPPLPPTPEQEVEALLVNADRLRDSGMPESIVASLIPYEHAALQAATLRATPLFVRARLGKALALEASDAGSPDAQAARDQALAAARGAGEKSLVAAVLDSDAESLLSSGRDVEALARFRESAVAHQEAGEFEAEGLAHLAASDAAQGAGREDDSFAELSLALTTFRHLGREHLALQALSRRATLEREAGRREAELATCEEILTLLDEGQDPGLAGRTLVAQARARRSLGQVDAALTAAEQGAASCRLASDRACEADALETVAALQLQLGRPREASQPILEALRARREVGDRAGEGRAQQGLGLSLAALGRHEPALSALREAKTLLQESGSPGEKAAVQLDLARSLGALREDSEASSAFDAACEALRSTGSGKQEGFTSPVDLAQALEEHLHLLVRAGLWTRALEVVFALDLAEQDPALRAPDIEAARALSRREDATLIVWRALDDQVLALAVEPGGQVTGRSIVGLDGETAARLAQTAATLALEAAGAPAPKGAVAPTAVAPGAQPAVDLDTPLSAALRRAYDLLIVPIESTLGSSSASPPGLVILASGALSLLPASLLLDEEGHALGNRFEIALLRVTDLTRESIESLAMGLLVVEMPGRDDPSADLLAVHESLTGRKKLKGGDDGAVGVITDGGTSFLLGSAASEEFVRRRSSGAGVLVLLGPCASDARGGRGRGLVLERRGVEAPRDGFLSADEAALLGLGGAVVVLAGCESRADAALIEGFLRGGARSVIVPGLPLGEEHARAALSAVSVRLAGGAMVAEALRGVRSDLVLSVPAHLLPAAFDLHGSLR